MPVAYAGQVRTAISRVGAGFIGNYSCCTFNVTGQGTFFPQAGTHPFLGEPGTLTTVDEVRIETILPAEIQANERVIQAYLVSGKFEDDDEEA